MSVAKQTTDPYKVLQVSRQASTDEIRKAYLDLAKQHHPDRGGSVEYMRQINNAYRAIREQTVMSQTNPEYYPEDEALYREIAYELELMRQAKAERVSFIKSFLNVVTGERLQIRKTL